MFTKLYPVTDTNQVTFFLSANDELRAVLSSVDSSTQDLFRIEARRLFNFADRLGLNPTLSTKLWMPKGNRVITIARVSRDQYRIEFRSAFGGRDFEHFTGTEKALRRHLHEMRKRTKIFSVEKQIAVEYGYQFGSADLSGSNPYTFGTVWTDRIEGQPHLITRMLKTLAKYELAVNSAKDSLLELVVEQRESGAA